MNKKENDKMRNRILKKLNIILLLVLSFVVVLSNMFGIVRAAEGDVQGFIQDADDFIHVGAEGDSPIETETLEGMSNIIYNILLIIAIVIAVIVGMVIGIQFMTGSVSEKAKIKETLIPYVAGCIVIFGAFGIWKLIVNILKQL